VKNTLDKAGLTGSQLPSAAYSLRLLSSTYIGKAVNVRNSNNATQDIGFTANGDLDTVALKTFVGNGNGYVVTWYDQSGGAKNATQPTVASQPLIVFKGSVIRSSGNKPSIFLQGVVLFFVHLMPCPQIQIIPKFY